MFFATCSLPRVARTLQCINPNYVIICGTGKEKEVRFIAVSEQGRMAEVMLRNACCWPRLWVKVPMHVLELVVKVKGQITVTLENNERYGLHLNFEGETHGVRHRLKAADLGEEVLPPLADLRKQGFFASTRRR